MNRLRRNRQIAVNPLRDCFVIPEVAILHRDRLEIEIGNTFTKEESEAARKRGTTG